MPNQQRSDRSYPLPEAIDGEQWNVYESPNGRQAGITPHGNQMMVPMGISPVERLVRLHEMTHVAITPREEMYQAMVELPEALVNYCEDARVMGHMNRLEFGVEDMKGVISDFEMDQMIKDHPAHLAAIAAGTYGSGEHVRLAEKVEAAENTFLTGVFGFGQQLAYQNTWVGAETPGFDRTLYMVREIMKAFGDPREPDPPPPPVPDARLPEMAPPPPPKPEDGIIAPGLGPWHPMEIQEPPLTEKLAASMKARPKKLVDVRGRKLHRIGRLYQDGRVFSNKQKKKGGGAVLIDTSGSMKLTTEEVLALMIRYPGGVIASYSSHDGQGYLRVIARNGKRVPNDLLRTPGSGNGCDGPALEWIAKWPGPRFWISDAGVEGGAEGLRFCVDVCRKNNITRVDNAWEIVGKDT